MDSADPTQPQPLAGQDPRDTNDDLEERVRLCAAQLEAANRELEAFSYAVSHDLRAPLRAVSGFSRALAEHLGERLDAEGRDLLERVLRGVDRMNSMIDGLRAFSRCVRVELKTCEVDLDKVVRSVVADLRSHYPRAEVQVSDLPPVHGDPALLRELMAKVVDNALKFSAKRDRPRVEIGADVDLRTVDVFVRDNGAGFEQHYADKLFHPFGRLHGESEFPGTGIGLAIAKRIVERHGGRIHAEAAPDAGATFRFTLDFARREGDS
jgi:light-regulated signal transduction histidine kinase (bacteriophytochrome)